MKPNTFKSQSRRAFLGAAISGTSLALIPAAEAMGLPNILTVGVGGDHANLQSAMGSITASSISNGYLIKLLPGVHFLPTNGLTVKPYVHIEGCGQGVSTIACSGLSTLTVENGCKLSNLTLTGHFPSSNASAGIIRNPANREIIFRLENVDMYVTGGYQAAIVIVDSLHTCYFDNIAIYTTSVGLNLSGHCYINGLQLFLSGNATNTPYCGIQVSGYGRVYLWASKIGTGQGRTDRPGFGEDLEVTNDPLADIVAIYMPAGINSGSRVECYDLNSLVRNDNATSDFTRLNCIRSERGVARLYGGSQQALSPGNTAPLRSSLFQSGAGMIETHAARFSSSTGNIFGGNITATSVATTANNNSTLNRFRGGVILCNAAAGPFRLNLPSITPGFVTGVRFILVKQDGSSNSVTISGNGRNISGAPTVVLASRYQKTEVIATAAEWIIL